MSRPKNYQKTVVDGIKFDSKREAKRYQELKLLERAGEIRALSLQVVINFELGGVEIRYPPGKDGRRGRQMSYRPDFVYYLGADDKLTIEDSKGFLTDTYKIKRAIMYSMGYEILET